VEYLRFDETNQKGASNGLVPLVSFGSNVRGKRRAAPVLKQQQLKKKNANALDCRRTP